MVAEVNTPDDQSPTINVGHTPSDWSFFCKIRSYASVLNK